MEEATLTSKGQITIPKRIRDGLGIGAGRKVVFVLKRGGAVMIPRSEDPLGDLLKMRGEISFEEDEIESLVRQSKQQWSKL